MHHYGEQSGDSLKKQVLEVTYDPRISLLGIYNEKTIIKRDLYTLRFVAALFTIATTWTQSRCPLTGERIQKQW